jgi:hypothetical protein
MRVLKRCLLNNVTIKKRFDNFLKVTNKKYTIQEHTMHGRLKELVAGPLNRGPERYWAMLVVIALAAFDAFVHQDVYNAIAKVFMEEEANVVNTLDYSNGLTVLHKVLLEKVIYYQNRGGNCFIASFLTVLHVVNYNKRSL